MIFRQTYLVFFLHLLTQKWSCMKTRRSRYSLRANLYVGSHLNMETNRAARISSSPLFLLAWFFKSQNQFYLFYMVYLVCTYVYTHIMYLQPSLRALAIRQDLICMREQVENFQPFYPSVHCKRCFTQTLVTATFLWSTEGPHLKHTMHPKEGKKSMLGKIFPMWDMEIQKWYQKTKLVSE